MKTLISCLLALICMSSVQAQIKGVVFGSNNAIKSKIYGAKVKLLGANRGVITSEEGTFEIILPKELPDTLVFSARGFAPDSIVVTKKDRFISLEVVLYSDQLLPEVVASYKKGTHTISRLKTLHVEEIGAGELRKAACCNLSESFETNASVDVNVTDAVSGAKKIQMMGLDGVYTQIQLENIPYLRGLESSYGLNSLPGTWINSMQITKGTGNVVNGYESMAGLINIEVKKPHNMNRVFVNAFGSAMGRAELNFDTGFKLNDKWSSAWFVHGSSHFVEMDFNKDKFRDMPNGTNVALMNRYHYQGKKMEGQFGLNVYQENKVGGQTDEMQNVGPKFYRVNVDSRHADIFAKTGFFMKKPHHSIGIVYNAKYQQTNAAFGDRKFVGEEKRGYINAIYDGILGNTDHKFKVGLSGVYSDIQQQMDSLNDDRVELVPGAFAEYSFVGMRLSSVLGARVDYHNLFGVQFSPRVHLKYTLTEYTDLRFTVGKGWRVPNYMIDNISLLANSKTWIAPDTVTPEISWNIGGSVMQEFKFLKRKGNITIDYYYTMFENQMLVDRDVSSSQIVFNRLDGRSFSNSFQAELAYTVSKTIDLRFAYKYLDVRATYNGKLQQQVLLPKHRGFFNFAYKTRNKRWEFDLTTSVYGSSRLPQVLLEDGTASTENRSEIYPIVNAQITYNYKKWEFYLGGENLGNYRQNNPIINAENPFENTFDATRVWAPIYGINGYLGVRFTLKKLEEK
ncbi:MAG: TonB-dependent receptor [Crocinitomicaceae bacterium]|nr:TonB-dependent receptor [Crocinitomicaceae bacterium]MDG1776753.1 TonB-dependent receptor [Crocinitomicaceae bacterium]